MIERAIRAARLEVDLFDEVRHDEAATSQAVLVVVIAASAGGVGTALALIIAGAPISWFLGSLIFGAVLGIGGWFVWSFVTHWVGTNYLGGQAALPQVIRCAGFGMAPQTLSVAGFIPFLGPLISLAAMIWALVAMVIGVRQALQVTTGNAVIAGVVSAVIVAVAYGIIMSILSAAGLWWLYFWFARPF